MRLLCIAFMFVVVTDLFSAETDIILVEQIQPVGVKTPEVQVPVENPVKVQENVVIPNVKISGYTQFAYTSDLTLGGKEPFAVKVARFGLYWKLNDWTEFKIQPEFSKVATGGAVEFKELWACITMEKNYFKFKIGQDSVPFGFENNYSTSKRKVFDSPSYLSKVITSQYDYGIQWYGDIGDILSLRLSMINGSTTAAETDAKKDFAGMLMNETLKDIKFYLSVYSRYVSNRYETHYSFAVKYEIVDPLPIFFTLEYVGGKDSNGLKDVMDVITTLEVKLFSLILKDLSFIAPVIRLERWDADIWDGSLGFVSYYTFGVNMYFDRQVRVLTDYCIKDDNVEGNNKFNLMLQLNY